MMTEWGRDADGCRRRVRDAVVEVADVVAGADVVVVEVAETRNT